MDPKFIKPDLSKFNVGDYQAGPKWKVVCWYFVNYYFLYSSIPWPYSFKSLVLRLFGAKIGKRLVIKARVRIKNPWRLTIGDDCWLGEDVWIDNLENVFIGSNVSISQGAMLLTGNHDYTIRNFPYRLGPIEIHDGAWIGARSIVCSNVVCNINSVLTVNSVASKSLATNGIYSGHPAVYVKQRFIKG